jgi:hypothetical protein
VRTGNNQGCKWGVATLVCNDLLVKQLDDWAKINHICQVVWGRLTLARETVEVYNVYNPVGTPLNLDAWLAQAGIPADHQIIAGDFNIHHSYWRSNDPDSREGVKLLESILDSGKHCIMNEGRGTFKSSSSIDLFIASSEIANTSKWDLYGLFSDNHAMILTVGLEAGAF